MSWGWLVSYRPTSRLSSTRRFVTERARQSQFRQPMVRPAAAGRVPRSSPASTLVGVRPQAAATGLLVDIIHSSPYIAVQRMQFRGAFGTAIDRRLVDSRPAAIAQRKPQELADAAAKGAIQRAISNSALYPPTGATAPLITALEGQIAAADATAQAQLAHPPGGVHTPHQATYIRSPNPTRWGCCVEEQLNPLAAAIGWNTQVALPGARPDYGRNVAPNIELYVDLTTVAQAGVGGNHITVKLNRSVRPHHVVWHAADITHNGPPGGPAPHLRTNGHVSPTHLARFQAYHRHVLRPGSGFRPKKDDLKRRYGNVSHATFTQIWNANQRSNFSTAAKKAGFR